MQKAFNEQFYEEDENEKPVFEDDLDDIENWDEWQGDLDGTGECCVRTVYIVHSTPVKIGFIYDDGMHVMSNDE